MTIIAQLYWLRASQVQVEAHLEVIKYKRNFTEQMNLELSFERTGLESAEKRELLGKKCQKKNLQLSLVEGHKGSCLYPSEVLILS